MQTLHVTYVYHNEAIRHLLSDVVSSPRIAKDELRYPGCTVGTFSESESMRGLVLTYTVMPYDCFETLRRYDMYQVQTKDRCTANQGRLTSMLPRCEQVSP